MDLVDRLHNRIETTPGGTTEICAAVAPSAAERAALQRRLADLDDWLTVGKPGPIERAVATMLAPYGGGSSRDDEGSGREIVRQYALAVRQFPAWVVVEACDRIRGNRVPGLNPDFAPKPPRLVAVCQDIVGARLDERAKLKRILDARIYALPSEEERERILRGFDAAWRGDFEGAQAAVKGVWAKDGEEAQP